MTRFLIIIFIICIVLVALNCFGYIGYTDEEIVNAIFKAEGEYKADYLYGIRSVKYKNEAEARQICFNSVRNSKIRWAKAGKPEDFISFMGKRYCPPKAHSKNSNWVRNVKWFLVYNREGE